MNIPEIIDRLCAHEITRDQAKEKIQKIIDQYRQKVALEFEVLEVAYSVEYSHARLKIEKRHGWPEIEGKVKKGDKIEVIIKP